MAKFIAKNGEDNYKIKLPSAGNIHFIKGIYETNDKIDIDALSKSDFIDKVVENATVKGGKK